MNQRIAFVNEKGGTAKTTLAVHAAVHLASQGLRTALLDMDPQGHAGKCLDIIPSSQEPSIFEALVKDQMPLTRILKKTRVKNLWLAPSDTRLADFTVNIVHDEHRQSRLATAIEPLGDYDAILIDSAPSLGLGAINVLMASREVIIPVPLTYLGMDGCIQTIKSVLRLRKIHSRKEPDVRAVVPVMFNGSREQKRILSSLQKRFASRMAKVVVPFDDNVDQAQSAGLTVYETNPESRVAISLAAFSKEISDATVT